MKLINKNLKHFLLTITGTFIGTSVGMSHVSQAQAAQLRNLVVNGDFTADSLLNPNDPTRANPFITGWDNSEQNDIFYTTYLENYTVDRVGELSRSVRMAAAAGEPNWTSFLSQNLPTDEGQRYRLTYYLANADEDNANAFWVYVGGNLVDEKVNLPLQDFRLYTVDFTATSNNTELRFASRQRYAWYNIDNVSVVELEDDNQQSTVPEPSAIAGIAVLGLMGFRVKKNRLAKS